MKAVSFSKKLSFSLHFCSYARKEKDVIGFEDYGFHFVCFMQCFVAILKNHIQNKIGLALILGVGFHLRVSSTLSVPMDFSPDLGFNASRRCSSVKSFGPASAIRSTWMK